VFEDQSQKLFGAIGERLNGLFVKRPLVFSVSISALVSLGVLGLTLDYRQGEARVEVVKGKSGEQVVTETAAKTIQVDLAGAVTKPGVYQLPEQARLVDVLAVGGGVTGGVSSAWVSKNLNLAQPLVDGAKVYIPFEWDVAATQEGSGEVRPLHLGVIAELTQGGVNAGASQSSSSAMPAEQGSLNANTATPSDLDLLPGIGPTYASRIAENRPYTSFEEFKEKSGLPASLAESLKGLLTF
jgi:competence protein ComEA